ncbi:MAG: metallophosphoesterase [Campylobacterales bacterium]|nr:metallophosphoesterase [Campylobacterales bacterium]
MNPLRIFLPLLTVLLFWGCGFEYSPYLAEPGREGQNTKNIARIEAQQLAYPLRIALISDTHSYYHGLEEVLSSIKHDRFDFVLHAGDITDAGLQKEYDLYDDYRKKLSIPFVHAVGNHDALTNGMAVFRNRYGLFDFSFRVAQTHFIVFNNNTWEFGNAAYDLTWLESELQEARAAGGNIILINHIPTEDFRFDKARMTAYKALLERYEVSLIICGHDHAHRIETIGSVTQVVVGSVSKEAYVELIITGFGRGDFMLRKIDV